MQLFRVCTWLVLLSSTAAALSTSGIYNGICNHAEAAPDPSFAMYADVPVALWRHVLNTEPNRHIEQLAQVEAAVTS
jgi:S-formylglutathione hydrolase FrmB